MFGPPGGVTRPSSCPCVVHVVSRLPPPTDRPVRTRFRFGSAAERLNLADDGKSPDHYAKGTPSPGGRPHRAPIACRHVVSGSLSSPGRGSSHRSLALLCAIGRRRVLSLAGWAPPIRTAFHVRGLTQVSSHHPSPAAYGALTRCGPPFQMVPLEYLTA